MHRAQYSGGGAVGEVDEELRGEGGQVNEDQKVEIRSSCGLVISCTGGGGAGNRGRVSCDPSATKTSTFSSR